MHASANSTKPTNNQWTNRSCGLFDKLVASLVDIVTRSLSNAICFEAHDSRNSMRYFYELCIKYFVIVNATWNWEIFDGHFEQRSWGSSIRNFHCTIKNLIRWIVWRFQATCINSGTCGWFKLFLKDLLSNKVNEKPFMARWSGVPFLEEKKRLKYCDASKIHAIRNSICIRYSKWQWYVPLLR